MSDLTNTFVQLQEAREKLNEGIAWAESVSELKVGLTLTSVMEGRNHPAPRAVELGVEKYFKANAMAIIGDYLDDLLDEVTGLEREFRKLSASNAQAFPDVSKKITAIRSKTI